MVVSSLADNKYLRYFFYVVLGELFLMGSGQDLPIVGSLTLRMLNFLVGLVISAYLFIRTDEFPKAVLGFILAYLMMMVVSFMLGIVFDSPQEYLFEDLKPLTYFYMLLFFYYMLSSELIIGKVLDILLWAVKVMTVLYLLYMLVTDILGFFSLEGYYQAVDDSGSFMFRGVGSALFYKGFIFLPIGALGFFKRKQYVWMLLTIGAIYFTYTRGLYVLLAFGLLVYYLKTHEVNIYKIIGIVLIALLFYEVAEAMELFSFGDSFAENREESDEVRFTTIREVFERITWWSLFVGHGFGQGVPERPVHMEISYLDIFHHQGLMGLFFWGALLVGILIYGNTVPSKYKETADFYITAALMIYLQSCFNPYVNNPIGMSMVMLAFVICFRLSQDENLSHSSSLQGRLPADECS